MTITTDATPLEKDKTAKEEAAMSPGRHKLYLATWRWHFYAGIFVIPFMIMLPFTGLIMLYHDTIESIQYRDMLFTEPANQAISAEAQAQAVRDHFPESVVSQYIPPAAEGRTSQITIITPDEQNLTVFVDPYSGDIMGTLDQSTTLYSWANNVHGSLFMGDTGDMLIEIAAGFGVLLVISGLYLWWPRDSIRGAFVPRLRVGKRMLWRNLHSSVGFYISVVLLFFLISGLSWTNVWGDKFVQAWNSFPAEKWGNVPLSDQTHASLNHGVLEEVSWNLEQTPLPVSGSMAGADGIPEGFAVNLDSVMVYATDNGFTQFRVNLPRDTEGVYTVSADTMSGDITDPRQDRTLHIDQYTGKKLGEVGWEDYSLMAKGMAAGIALHQGDAGVLNRVFNTVFCLAVLFMAISGLVMWWLRRPQKAIRLAAPPLPADMPYWRGAMVIMLLVSLAFPLVGVTLLSVLALDICVLSRIPVLKQAFS